MTFSTFSFKYVKNNGSFNRIAVDLSFTNSSAALLTLLVSMQSSITKAFLQPTVKKNSYVDGHIIQIWFDSIR